MFAKGVCLSIFLLLFDTSFEMVDLFQGRTSSFRNGIVTESVGCESLILQTFEKLNGTGVKMFRTTESLLSECPNICDEPENKNRFCTENEQNFVEAFSADIKSDRCCDERSCKCICHYTCNTFETKLEFFKQAGYKRCIWAKSKNSILKKSTRYCKKKYEDRYNCDKTSRSFVCPRQYVCVGNRCLSCINPSCILEEEKSKMKLLIAALNNSEHNAIDKLRQDKIEHNSKLEDAKRDSKGKSYRGLTITTPLETNLEGGFAL